MLCTFNTTENIRQSDAIRAALQQNHEALKRVDRPGYNDYVVALWLDPECVGDPIVAVDSLDVFVLSVRRDRRALSGMLCNYSVQEAVSEDPFEATTQPMRFCLQATDSPAAITDCLAAPKLRRQEFKPSHHHRNERLLAPWAGTVSIDETEHGAVIRVANQDGDWQVARFRPREWKAMQVQVSTGARVEVGATLAVVRKQTAFASARVDRDARAPIMNGPCPELFDLGIDMVNRLSLAKMTQTQLAARMPKLLVEVEDPAVNGIEYRGQLLRALGPSGSWCIRSKVDGTVRSIAPAQGAPHLMTVMMDTVDGPFSQHYPADGFALVNVGDSVEFDAPLANPVPRLHYSKWADLEGMLPDTLADWLLAEFVADQTIPPGAEFEGGDWNGGTLWPVDGLDTTPANCGTSLSDAYLFWDIRGCNFPKSGLVVLGAVDVQPPVKLAGNFYMGFGLPRRKRITDDSRQSAAVPA